MENNIVNIPLKGIARAGSDLSCEDGLCNEVIGLEYKDGSYVPVTIEEEEAFSSFIPKCSFVHKTSFGDIKIIITETNFVLYKKDDTYKTIENFKEEVDKIDFIGNAMRIKNKVYLYYDGKYNEINLQDINFSMQLDVRRNGVAMLHDWCDESVQKEFKDGNNDWKGYWLKNALQQLETDVKNAEYLTGMAYMCYAIKLYDGTYIKSSTPVLVCDTDDAYFSNFQSIHSHAPNSIKFTKEYSDEGFASVVRQIGYLTNFGWKFNEIPEHFEDYDISYTSARLFETNIMTSGSTFLREDRTFNNPKSIKTMKWEGNNFSFTQNNYQFDRYDENIKDKYQEISSLDMIDVNGKSASILKPTSDYDNRLPNKQHGEGPNEDVWTHTDISGQVSTNEDWYAKKSPSGRNWFNAMYDTEIPSEYIYCGNKLGIYYKDGVSNNATKTIHQLFAARNLATPIFRIVENKIAEYQNLVVSVDVFMTRPVSIFEDMMSYDNTISNQRKFKSKEAIEKELKNSLVSFYKILEIPYDDLVQMSEDKIYVPFIERGKISQIEQQELLPKIYPHIDSYKTSYTFNNRLHISTIETLFKTELGVDLCLIHSGITRNSMPLSEDETYIISLKVKDMLNTTILYGTLKRPHNSYAYLSKSIVLSDDRIQEMQILGKIISDSKYKKYNEPIILNFEASNGYAVYSNLNVFNIDGSGEETDIPSEFFNNQKIVRNGNIFKVSSANNLIDFPLAQTYQVGNGDIVGFATASKALSQGQFGQFPLYVFTTDGIYAMDTNGQGTYSSMHPISREVCNNSNGILQLDGAILFTTNKGLMILSGSEVAPFAVAVNGDINFKPEKNSNVYDGANVYNNAMTKGSLVQLKGNLSQEDFVEFVSDENTRLSYVYDKDKVLVYNSTKAHSYLIDIKTQIATKIPYCVKFGDGNYPKEMYGVDGEKNINLCSIPYKIKLDEYAQTMFQTRPIKVNTYGFKSAFRVVLRGRFEVEEGKKAGLYVLGSNDTERWMYLGGTERGGKFVDLGTTIHRVSCKYLMVIYVGSISGDSKINGLEISSNVKYNNKLK